MKAYLITRFKQEVPHFTDDELSEVQEVLGREISLRLLGNPTVPQAPGVE